MAVATDALSLRGVLRGHRGWVTAIACNESGAVVSSSRDKTLIQWKITRGDGEGALSEFGTAHRALKGYVFSAIEWDAFLEV